MKVMNKVLVFICLIIFVSSCSFYGIWGSGIKESETRSVESFNRVNFDSVADVTITQGDYQSIVITGDDNLLKYIKTVVTDGELRIYNTEDYNTNIGISIEIVVPVINRVKLSGVGDIDLTNIYSDSLDLELKGVGNINGSGYATILNAELSGVGDINLSNLNCTSGDVDLSGVGDIKVRADSTLNLSHTGVGDIKYYGTASIYILNDDGIGKISCGN
ncbi:MAG: DUF2807 domain-containing protein [Spirochaetales bacterium]|nr:DUF2807 domain-containing protein [Spirochaetales bacterium]